MSEIKCELRHYIENWVREMGYHNVSPDCLATPHYATLLDHLLQDSGKMLGKGKTVEENIKSAITSAVSGKKILEVGCRSGIFLKFLQAHGAIVAGSTGEKYFDRARTLLGKNAIVAKASAEKAGFSKELQDFKPNMVISFNLFDLTRWFGIKAPLGRFYASAHRLASKGTRFYVVPADSSPLISPKEFRKAGRIRGVAVSVKYADGSAKYANDYSTGIADQSIRFRIGPKRKPVVPKIRH